MRLGGVVGVVGVAVVACCGEKAVEFSTAAVEKVGVYIEVALEAVRRRKK